MLKSVQAIGNRALLSDYFILGLGILYFLVMMLFTPGMSSPLNVLNLTEIMLPLMILATGQTFVLITGGIDLSATSNVALCSVIGGIIMNTDTGWLAGHPMAVPVGIFAMFLVGAGIGLGNGILVAILRMPPFMVTLIGMLFLSGVAIRMTRSLPIANLPDSFNQVNGNPAIAVSLTIGLLVLAHVYLVKTIRGQWLYAVGQNSKAARVSGIPVERTVISAYVISGLCAAAGSVLLTARLESASPVLGQKMLLDIISAAIIGGTSLFGGRGTVRGTVFGVLLISIVTNSLDLLGLTFALVMFTKGMIILVAAGLDAFRNRQLAGRT